MLPFTKLEGETVNSRLGEASICVVTPDVTDSKGLDVVSMVVIEKDDVVARVRGFYMPLRVTVNEVPIVV